MRLLCSNCESAPASVACQQCCIADDNDGRFCAECGALHLRIKQFKAHSIGPLGAPLPLRSNDKRRVAGGEGRARINPEAEITMTEEEEDGAGDGDIVRPSSTISFPSVRQFAVHPKELYARYVAGTALGSGIDASIEALDAFVDIVSAAFEDRAVVEIVGAGGDGGEEGVAGPWTVFICLLIALAIHLVTKYVLRRKAVFALIGLGLFAFQSFKKKRDQLSGELNLIQKTSHEVRGSLRQFGSVVATPSVSTKTSAAIASAAGGSLRRSIGGTPDCRVATRNDDDDEEEEEEEGDDDEEDFRFWHERDATSGRRATLRLRGARKYQGRPSAARSSGSGSSSPSKQSSSPAKQQQLQQYSISDEAVDDLVHEKVN